MILHYPFTRNNNKAEITLVLNLELLRNYHEAAKFEYDVRADSGEDLTTVELLFEIDFNIPSITALINFEEQIKLLKRKLLKSHEYENLLFLAMHLVKTEKHLFKSEYKRYENLKREVENISLIGKYAHLNNLSSLELTFIDKDPRTRPKIIANDRLPRFLILSMLKQYRAYLFSDHLQDLSWILNKEVTEDNLTYGDLLDAKKKLKKFKPEDYNKAFRKHFYKTLLAYIRENNLFSIHKKSASAEPDAHEARLVYFISCVTNEHQVLPKSKPENPKYFKNKVTKSSTGAGSSTSTSAVDIINYNDSIINGIKKTFRDFKTNKNEHLTLMYTPDLKRQLFELLVPKYPFF